MSGRWARLAQVGVHVVLASHLAALLLVPAVHGARRLPPVHARLPLRLDARLWQLSSTFNRHKVYGLRSPSWLAHATIALANQAKHQG